MACLYVQGACLLIYLSKATLVHSRRLQYLFLSSHSLFFFLFVLIGKEEEEEKGEGDGKWKRRRRLLGSWMCRCVEDSIC